LRTRRDRPAAGPASFLAPGARPRAADPLFQWIAIGLAALPAAVLAGRFALEGFGAEPVEAITHTSGEWGLRWILVSLAITPTRQWLGWRRIAPLRRTFGLAGFAYACVHLTTWAVLDRELDLGEMAEDLTKRPYVMAGMAAFLLLVPLAVTSTRSWMKRLGARWVRLHRAVYAAAILAVLHHFWLIKADYAPAIAEAVVLASLLAARGAWRARRTTIERASRPSAP
jgi:sulfoxide reductase heme-binding subunit YedZ